MPQAAPIGVTDPESVGQGPAQILFAKSILLGHHNLDVIFPVSPVIDPCPDDRVFAGPSPGAVPGMKAREGPRFSLAVLSGIVPPWTEIDGRILGGPFRRGC